MARRRFSARIEGHVQGVGFRYTAAHIASRHPIAGYVRNRSDGGVDLVAEGEEGDLNAFLSELRQSSVYRHVRAENLAWSGALDDLSGFEVRPSA